MSLETSAGLLCTRCGAAASSGVSDCEKCGGKMAKLCPGCSFKNSPQKKYCDRCGGSLAGGPVQNAPEPETSEIPKTVLKRSTPSSPEGLQLPQAGRVEQGSPPTPPPTGPIRRKTTSRIVSRSNPKIAPLARAVLAVLILGGAGSLYLRLNDPRKTALRAAGEYLELVDLKDGAAAYSLLSSQSKANCDPAQFKSLLGAPARAGADRSIDPAKIELAGNTARVPYGKTGGQLFLVFEQGRWAVVYNQNLLARAREALGRGDADMALLLGQSALRVSPEDPEARDLLCRTYTLRKMDAQFQNECLKKS